jgi:hypothetical protein
LYQFKLENGLRCDARMDEGLGDIELQNFFRGYSDDRFSERVGPGWRASVLENHRRNPGAVKWRGRDGWRYLHLKRGTLPTDRAKKFDHVVLEFFFLPMPIQVVDQLNEYAERVDARWASLGAKEEAAKGDSDGLRQFRDESVSTEERPADAGRRGEFDAEVSEGGAGARGAEDWFEGLPGSEELPSQLSERRLTFDEVNRLAIELAELREQAGA